MEGSRSTWQYWHVYAEAQRQVRAANVPTNQVSQVVDLLVSEVLDDHSVSMARPWDTINEPAELRRADGSSVSKRSTSRSQIQAVAATFSPARRSSSGSG